MSEENCQTSSKGIFATAKPILEFASVAVGILFLSGIFYEQGYFEQFGINRESFPSDFHEVVAAGSYSIASIGARVLKQIFFPFLIFLITSFFIGQLVHFVLKNEWIKLKENKIISWVKVRAQVILFKTEYAEMYRKMVIMQAINFSSFVVFVLLFSIIYVANKGEGAKNANAIVDGLKESLIQEKPNQRVSLNVKENGKKTAIKSSALRQLVHCREDACIFLTN